MKIRLRDVFWLLVIVGLACALWRERSRTQVLAMEARYYQSAAPPIQLIETPLEEALNQLAAGHGVTIEVDWPSIEKVLHWNKTTPTTHNLADGSLTSAIERIFCGEGVIEGIGTGIRIRGRDPERDAPAKEWWGFRMQRKGFNKAKR